MVMLKMTIMMMMMITIVTMVIDGGDYGCDDDDGDVF